MNIDPILGAELAYRRERVSQYFRPRRRVGGERTSARMPSAPAATGRPDATARTGTDRTTNTGTHRT